MFSHQGPVLSVCWNKVRRYEFFHWIRRLMEIYRREIVSSQREPTTLAECMMFRPVRPLKSQNMTALSASVSTSTPPVAESLLPEVGIRQSRFEMITPFDTNVHSPGNSTGIFGVRTRYPLLLSPNVAIVWMYPIH